MVLKALLEAEEESMGRKALAVLFEALPRSNDSNYYIQGLWWRKEGIEERERLEEMQQKAVVVINCFQRFHHFGKAQQCSCLRQPSSSKKCTGVPTATRHFYRPYPVIVNCRY